MAKKQSHSRPVKANNSGFGLHEEIIEMRNLELKTIRLTFFITYLVFFISSSILFCVSGYRHYFIFLFNNLSELAVLLTIYFMVKKTFYIKFF